jgi:hypothetical protein
MLIYVEFNRRANRPRIDIRALRALGLRGANET